MCSTHVFHIQCIFITHMNTKLNTTGYIRNIYRCTCGHTCINTSLGKRRRMSCAYRHISNRMLICALHMFCLCMCLCWLVLPYVLIICFYMCQHMYKILFSQNFAILRSYTYVYTYANTCITFTLHICVICVSCVLICTHMCAYMCLLARA